MKVEVKKVDATKRELRIEIPQDRVSRKLEEVYQDISKAAKIRGFRPGKAPRSVVEGEHGSLAQEEMIKKIIPEAYQEGLTREKIVPMDYPEIVDVAYKEGKVSFTAKLDIRPEVKIKNYKGITVKRQSPHVTEEEINKTLEFFKKGKGGAEIAIDDAFARGLGYPNLEDFKNFLKRQMEMDKDRQNRADIENQILEYLLKESSLPLPASIVRKQEEHLLREQVKHLRSRRMPEEEIKKKEAELREELKPVAERDIKIFLILEKIAELENMTIGQNDNLPHAVMEFLLKNANWDDQ